MTNPIRPAIAMLIAIACFWISPASAQVLYSPELYPSAQDHYLILPSGDIFYSAELYPSAQGHYLTLPPGYQQAQAPALAAAPATVNPVQPVAVPYVASAATVAQPAHNWTGFYAGGVASYGDGTTERNFSQSGGGSTGRFDVNGGMGGITAGYNYQFGSIVAGLEGDISGGDVSGKETGRPNSVYSYYAEDNWLGTARPRVGYAFDSVMPYLTGGFAEGNVRVHSKYGLTGATGSDFTDTVPGWTAGGGFEAALDSQWSVKAEYLYVQFSDIDGPSSIGAPTTSKLDENIIRVGLNYKF